MSNSLFNKLPTGCHHLQNYLDERIQRNLVVLCRQLLGTHPLMKPTTKTGYPLSLSVSSWGKAGWFGENGEYSYMPKHKNGTEFPPIPPLIEQYVREALVVTKFGLDGFSLDTVLLNWYPPGKGKLGKHRDVTEEDQIAPIVTISLGDSCLFNIGGLEYDDPMQDIELRSGDVLVIGGKSRLIYHEVKSLISDSSQLLKEGGRISLTGRKVFRDGGK